MYALKNVESFVSAHPDQFPAGEAQKILQRARENAEGKLVTGGMIEEILGNASLAELFDRFVMDNPLQLQIARVAMDSLKK